MKVTLVQSKIQYYKKKKKRKKERKKVRGLDQGVEELK